MTNRTEEDMQWDALIAAQNGDNADVVPLTDRGQFMRGGEIISDGSGEISSLMRVSDLRYKGYRPVWDTKTGQESLQPRWLLWQTMSKKHPDGTQAFTLVNPHIPPDYGEDLTCPFSPDAPLDQRVSGMGFKACNNGRGKRHIPNHAALESHLQHTHPRAYAALERVKVERQREEDRAMQLEAIETQNKLLKAMIERQSASTEPAETPKKK